ncbi:division/cell wall cluster transcriptional repressor MraZ [Glaesserella parasuis]|uniref:division/cell wall cluster transcriptional repressor MraZ n=1 Tax=Glaesserella parasuis TaxID=738 RepID=UPI001365EE6B|nr:division/cell wall cluster transcriptional repressor MraZ [Glaesserella parasuis]MDG6266716.1 division/cell wall cluster transcriptional repressor MraZ [Glaesserella parasuis]MDG6293947.1 division/cell wall cluster transcriptional repressor MraZ [Glaesserella parasuis]MDG6366401.1 division/cell wall cluster transcriptional repressor MraZ [Glaesserella parasuis]MDG6372787.1 division/cell wall cluster transcriptional repressor MraZ [Glaesserella parasuis]MDG6444711.1 division/cell wall cluste
MFRGATSISIDSKGRIAIPTRYRAELLERHHGAFVCTVDIRQPCLLLYPLHEWEIVEQKLLALSNFDPAQRRIQRVMQGFATECEMDSAGRILLSPTLRQHAQLEQQIMLVGQLNKFEIWQDQQWQKQISEDLAIGGSEEMLHCEALKNLSL